MFERIPKELKENALFCLYKLEERQGKQTKVPYQVHGARAAPNNPNCYKKFETVMRVYEKGGYAGLGIGVFEPYVMIDIDHCVTNGEFADVFKGIARYVPERKKWYVYDGIRWKDDVGSMKVMELSKDLADAQHYATCMSTYVLFKYGEVRDESKDAAIFNGTFGY